MQKRGYRSIIGTFVFVFGLKTQKYNKKILSFFIDTQALLC